jgi:hypothetical protein
MVGAVAARVIADGRWLVLIRPTSETTATRAAGTLRSMRIQNAQRVSEAIQTLSAGTSLDTLVDRLYDLTDGSLALDRATLHRIARGKTQVARAIDSPEECIRLYFALMIVGCERELPVTSIADEGHAVLAGFVGEPLASLIFRDLAATLPKLTDRHTLREYLGEGLRVWLPK